MFVIVEFEATDHFFMKEFEKPQTKEIAQLVWLQAFHNLWCLAMNGKKFVELIVKSRILIGKMSFCRQVEMIIKIG